MVEFWSVHNIAFTLMGYPMSYIELLGTILYLWSVWLIARENILTWPVGILSVLLYMGLFYQIHLYSDFFEGIYALFISFYGWWRWRTPTPESAGVLTIEYSSRRQLLVSVGVTLGLSLAGGALMSRIHLILPSFFQEPASFPYLDALTTIMSFTAMYLMARKYVESWYYWIIIDTIGIGLYYAKEVKLIALLYVILLVMAVDGLRTWKKAVKSIHSEQ